MSADDKTKWDNKYRRADKDRTSPSALLTGLAQHLPARGQALDLAGGAGRNAIWLAQRGLNVTVADISQIGLNLATKRAVDAGVALQTVQVDLESDPFPPGPWDLILCICFLQRALFPTFPQHLNRGGVLIVIHPTRNNLQRHAKPPASYLLEDAELPQLAHGLETVHYEEGWLAEGRHDAVLVTRRPADHKSN